MITQKPISIKNAVTIGRHSYSISQQLNHGYYAYAHSQSDSAYADELILV